MALNMAALEKKNQENLKAVKSGAKVKYKYGKAGSAAVIMIGVGHSPDVVKMFETGQAYAGEIEVLREAVVGKGELKVSGCKANRREFDVAMARITKKKILYV